MLLSCTIANPVVTISNFLELTKDTLISFNIYGVMNPQTPGSQTITVSIVDSSSRLIESKSFSVTFTSPAFSPYTFTASVQALPNNAQLYSIYYFIFTPDFVIPPNANITLIFPDTYGLLYSAGSSNIQCVSRGGLKYLKSCVNEIIEGIQTIQMFTLESSVAGQQITLEYYGLVMYPNQADDLTGFKINIYFDTILIASSQVISTKITNQIGI